MPRQSAERAARPPLAEAEREAQRLDTEARTLAKVLNLENGNLFPPLVDRLTVEKGYETALGAALGDDIEAPLAAERRPAGPIPGRGRAIRRCLSARIRSPIT